MTPSRERSSLSSASVTKCSRYRRRAAAASPWLSSSSRANTRIVSSRPKRGCPSGSLVAVASDASSNVSRLRGRRRRRPRPPRPLRAWRRRRRPRARGRRGGRARRAAGSSSRSSRAATAGVRAGRARLASGAPGAHRAASRCRPARARARAPPRARSRAVARRARGRCGRRRRRSHRSARSRATRRARARRRAARHPSPLPAADSLPASGSPSGGTRNSCSTEIRSGTRLVARIVRAGAASRMSATSRTRRRDARGCRARGAGHPQSRIAYRLELVARDVTEPERGRDGRQDELRVGEWREVDERGARMLLGNCNGESRLARSAGAGQRDQAHVGPAQQRVDRRQLEITPDQRGRHGRIGATRPHRRRELGIVPEDLLLERAQLGRRLQPEVVQRRPCVAIRGKRICLPA